MKPLLYFSGLVLMAFSTSCSTTRNTTQTESDDRYYSLADARRESRQLRKLNQQTPSETNTYTQDAVVREENYDYSSGQAPVDGGSYAPATQNSDGSTTIINNYYDDYDMDNYYDYMYSSRIRRFYRPNAGFGYYDPFYTNMYWYNNDPFMYGNSIYTTYSFFNPYVPWGWNSYSPGVNFGWNSYTGWHFNVGFGGWNNWGNPWVYYNPWRWNSWGYTPYYSPFAYNPYFYSPFNSYGWGYNNGYYNGFNNGLSYGLMMNSMYSNPVYYNSYDINTYNTSYNNSVYYGANTGGIGSGSSFTSAPNLTSNFSKELGISTSAFHDGKTKNPTLQTTNNSVGQPVKVQGQTLQANPADKNQGGASLSGKPGQLVNDQSTKGQSNPSIQSGKPGQLTNVQAETPGKNTSSPNLGGSQPGKGNATAGGTFESPGKNTVSPSLNGSNQPVKGGVSTDVRPGGNFSAAPASGKDQLIQQGVVKPSKADNYTSAPVVRPQTPVTDNKPESPYVRPSNDIRNPGNGMSPTTTTPGRVETPKQQYNPSYNYNDGIRSNSNTVRPQGNQAPSRNDSYTPAPVRPETSSPRVNTPAQVPADQPRQQQNGYPQYNQPKGNTYPQAPRNDIRNNTPQYQAPQAEPRNSTPQYQAPRTEPRNSTPQYQAPRTEPRNSAPQYQTPSQEPRNNYQQYQSPSAAPRNSAPQYQAPRSEPRYNQPSSQPRQESPSYQTPQREQRNSYQQYQTPQREQRMERQSAPQQSSPRMESPRMQQSSPRMESSPRMNSGGGSVPKSGSHDGGSNRINSPRR